jgi:transposase
MFFIGIDVHKKKLDVVVLLEPDTLKKRQKTVPNPPEGFQTLITWCQKQTGAVPAELHAVMEATGPYHEALAHALHDAGLVVSVSNPKAVKDLCQGLGHQGQERPHGCLAHRPLWDAHEAPPVATGAL